MSTVDPETAEAQAGAVWRWLGLGDASEEWLAELSAADGTAGPTRLPGNDEAAETMGRMGVPERDAAEALDAVPTPDDQPELWWLLHRCRQLLVSRLGREGSMARWPAMPSSLGAHGRYFYLWVFLSAVPEVREYHRAHGVPDQVSWDTLADIGAKVALHRRTHGVGGLDKQDWFTLHFRGLLYALGRLQFNVARIGAQDAPLAAGTPCLGAHIPEAGPMTPEQCDESFQRAPGFFARHFGTRHSLATCTSWLLDDQLTEYLPGSSNILRFQRRFQLLPGGYEGDRDILEFVFRRVDPPLSELPQDTTLQRAVVAHLGAGRHWRIRTGWLEL
jgi:hypothetical protein